MGKERSGQGEGGKREKEEEVGERGERCDENLNTDMCMLLLTHEIVIPGSLGWDHEEAQEPIRKKHLHLLIVGGQVAMGIVASVLVATPPLIT